MREPPPKGAGAARQPERQLGPGRSGNRSCAVPDIGLGLGLGIRALRSLSCKIRIRSFSFRIETYFQNVGVL